MAYTLAHADYTCSGSCILLFDEEMLSAKKKKKTLRALAPNGRLEHLEK